MRSREYRNVLQHRGVDPFAPTVPLAQLGLARAHARNGDTGASRAAYQELFAIWKKADADFAPLLAARAEYGPASVRLDHPAVKTPLRADFALRDPEPGSDATGRRRSIGRAICASSAMSRSRSCVRKKRPAQARSTASGGKRASLRSSRIRTSAPSTTPAKRIGQPFLVCELLEGRALDESVAAEGPLPPDRVIDIGMQIADALGAVHRRGVVHAQPETVERVHHQRRARQAPGARRGRGGRPPRRPAPGNAGRASQTTPVTPPSRRRLPASSFIRISRRNRSRAPSPTSRSDIFATGALLYEMATGTPAFNGASLAETDLRHHCARTGAGRATCNRVCPPALEAIILRALDKNPDQRYQRAAELVDDLRRARRTAARPAGGRRGCAPGRVDRWRASAASSWRPPRSCSPAAQSGWWPPAVGAQRDPRQRHRQRHRGSRLRRHAAAGGLGLPRAVAVSRPRIGRADSQHAAADGAQTRRAA